MVHIWTSELPKLTRGRGGLMIMRYTIYGRFLLMVALTTTMRTVVRQIVTELPKTTHLWSRSSYNSKDEVSWVVWDDGGQHYLYGGCSGLFGVAVCVLFPLVEEFKSC